MVTEPSAIRPGNTMNLEAGSNIVLTKTEVSPTVSKVHISTSPKLTADSLTINNGGPTISNTGIDMNNTVISNVAEGSAPNDAVNVQQLNKAVDSVRGNFAGVVNQMNENRKISSGGIAAAMAFEHPLDTQPGKISAGVGVAHFDGQSAMALSTSYLTPNAKTRFSVGVAGSTASKVGVRAGMSFVFD